MIMKCEACMQNEVPINEDYGCAMYIVTTLYGDDREQMHSLCKNCYDKINNILCYGTRKSFAETYPLNPQN